MPIQLQRPGISNTAPDMPDDMPAALPAPVHPLNTPDTCCMVDILNDMILDQKEQCFFGLPQVSMEDVEDHYIQPEDDRKPAARPDSNAESDAAEETQEQGDQA